MPPRQSYRTAPAETSGALKLRRTIYVLIHEQRRVPLEALVFHFLTSITGLAMTIAATALGFWQARRFTVNRLQYVDAVQNGIAPVLAGIGAAIIALPVVAFLPLVGTGTALLFGLSVALGVSSGARDIRKRLGAG